MIKSKICNIEDSSMYVFEDILGELIASVTHLHAHSAIVKEEMEKD